MHRIHIILIISIFTINIRIPFYLGLMGNQWIYRFFYRFYQVCEIIFRHTNKNANETVIKNYVFLCAIFSCQFLYFISHAFPHDVDGRTFRSFIQRLNSKSELKKGKSTPEISGICKWWTCIYCWIHISISNWFAQVSRRLGLRTVIVHMMCHCIS